MNKKSPTNKEISKLIKTTVEQTLTMLGFNLNDLSQTQADLLFLRRARLWQQDFWRIFWKSLLTGLMPLLLYISYSIVNNKII